MSEAKAFTYKYKHLEKRAVIIDTEVRFPIKKDGQLFYGSVKTKALIDTGANGSCISSRLASACRLRHIKAIQMISAQGISLSYVYQIDINLPNGINFCKVPVIEVSGGREFDVIIGMDILMQSDMAISNANHEMCFSLRMPPNTNHIDFTKQD